MDVLKGNIDTKTLELLTDEEVHVLVEARINELTLAFKDAKPAIIVKNGKTANSFTVNADEYTISNVGQILDSSGSAIKLENIVSKYT